MLEPVLVIAHDGTGYLDPGVRLQRQGMTSDDQLRLDPAAP